MRRTAAGGDRLAGRLDSRERFVSGAVGVDVPWSEACGRLWCLPTQRSQLARRRWSDPRAELAHVRRRLRRQSDADAAGAVFDHPAIWWLRRAPRERDTVAMMCWVAVLGMQRLCRRVDNSSVGSGELVSRRGNGWIDAASRAAESSLDYDDSRSPPYDPPPCACRRGERWISWQGACGAESRVRGGVGSRTRRRQQAGGKVLPGGPL